MKEKVVILTGAGISAESGLKTFRDADGLWEGHDVMEVASPQGWSANQELVLKFYNERRRQLLTVFPNAAHKAIVGLEERYKAHVITQNVDDLHERAGSSQVMHLHGELLKVRCTHNENDIQEWTQDLVTGDLSSSGHQLRPHIVWFGEIVPLLDPAAALVSQAQHILIIGTSMQVYPAAGLIDYAKPDTNIHFIDPHPAVSPRANLQVYTEKATTGVPKVVDALLSL